MGAGTYYGINYDYQFVDVPPVLVEANCQGKRVTMIDTVEVATATGLDAGTTITFFKPPQGSRLVGGNLFAEAGATVLLSGVVGPKAAAALKSAGLTVVEGLDGRTVGQAVDAYRAGKGA